MAYNNVIPHLNKKIKYQLHIHHSSDYQESAIREGMGEPGGRN